VVAEYKRMNGYNLENVRHEPSERKENGTPEEENE
jgi:hypothetical protein